MKTVRDKLLGHIGAIYKDCRVEQHDLEAEGLGLRPLTSAENMGTSVRNILARRYYRLGQWSEALQGGYWLTVSCLASFIWVQADGRIPTRRCFDTIRSLINSMIPGSVALMRYRKLV